MTGKRMRIGLISLCDLNAVKDLGRVYIPDGSEPSKPSFWATEAELWYYAFTLKKEGL